MKRLVDLSPNDKLVRESRSYRVNVSTKVEELAQAGVTAARPARQSHYQKAQKAVRHWNALHDASGSYADGSSTI